MQNRNVLIALSVTQFAARKGRAWTLLDCGGLCKGGHSPLQKDLRTARKQGVLMHSNRFRYNQFIREGLPPVVARHAAYTTCGGLSGNRC